MSTPSINVSNLLFCWTPLLKAVSSFQCFPLPPFLSLSISLFGPLVNQGCFQLSMTGKIKLEVRPVFVSIYKNMICYMTGNINSKCYTYDSPPGIDN